MKFSNLFLTVAVFLMSSTGFAGNPDVDALCSSTAINHRIAWGCHVNGEAAYSKGKVALFRAVCLAVPKNLGGINAVRKCTAILLGLQTPADMGLAKAYSTCSGMESKLASWGYEENDLYWGPGRLPTYLCMDVSL